MTRNLQRSIQKTDLNNNDYNNNPGKASKTKLYMY